MDSDDEEVLAALLEEEAEADVQEEEHLMVLNYEFLFVELYSLY